MKYQLIVQMRGDDFDALIGLEDAIAARLGEIGDVDGHDIGNGEMNVFVLTDDPNRAFERIKPVVPVGCTVAYRETKSDAYTLLSPPGLQNFKIT